MSGGLKNQLVQQDLESQYTNSSDTKENDYIETDSVDSDTDSVITWFKILCRWSVDEGDGDVDENAADEERDACSKCNTEGIMDIVF